MIPCIGLCASHIDNLARLELLKCSIDSMIKQSKKIPLWISISTPWECNALPRSIKLVLS